MTTVLIIAAFLAAILIVYQFIRRKSAERVLQESRQRFDLLVNDIKDYAIFQLDVNGCVVTWNEGARQIKGYTKEEIIGRHIDIFYPDEENRRGEPALNLKHAAEEGRYESVGRRRRKDGTVFWADVVFTALYDQKHQLTGYIKITKDITEMRRAQEEMERALERERTLNEMKSRFVTLASHEFKTPLSVILSSASLIEKYSAPEMADKRDRHIQRIKSNVENLKQLLNDFLSLEKLEEGIVSNKPQPVDVFQIARESILDIEGTCTEDQCIHLHTEGQPAILAVDPHLLRNILFNLLSNAIKYSPDQLPVTLTVGFEPGEIRITVADKGIGIPPGEQEHLFDRFFRASNTIGISGTGLGLSIVKRYLDLRAARSPSTVCRDRAPLSPFTFPLLNLIIRASDAGH